MNILLLSYIMNAYCVKLIHAPQAYCPLWGAKSARFWFSAPSMEVQDFHLRSRALPCSYFGLTPLSHISWRSAPRMPYKPLEQGMVYHSHTCVVVVHSWLLQGLINHEWGASLADVGLGCHRVKAPQKSQKPHTQY